MSLIRKREVKLPHERHQEHMHLDDPMEARERFISFSFLLTPDPWHKYRDLRKSPSNATSVTSGERSTTSKDLSPSPGGGRQSTPYRLLYTPTGDSTFSFMSNHLSGLNSSASGPHTSLFLRSGNTSLEPAISTRT
jgi:hypothetical protein